MRRNKIVGETCDYLLIEEADGSIAKYVVKQKSKKMHEKKVTKNTTDGQAIKLKECSVVLEILTESQIANATARKPIETDDSVYSLNELFESDWLNENSMTASTDDDIPNGNDNVMTENTDALAQRNALHNAVQIVVLNAAGERISLLVTNEIWFNLQTLVSGSNFERNYQQLAVPKSHKLAPVSNFMQSSSHEQFNQRDIVEIEMGKKSGERITMLLTNELWFTLRVIFDETKGDETDHSIYSLIQLFESDWFNKTSTIASTDVDTLIGKHTVSDEKTVALTQRNAIRNAIEIVLFNGYGERITLSLSSEMWCILRSIFGALLASAFDNAENHNRVLLDEAVNDESILTEDDGNKSDEYDADSSSSDVRL